MTGTIKRLVSDKGFGFITTPEIENDIFFHSSALEGLDYTQLREGDQVSFEIEETPKGLNAVSVKAA